MPEKNEIKVINGIRVFSLASALMACSLKSFTHHSSDIRTALSLIRDSSEILRGLLNGGHSTIAGRLAGAFRNIGREQIAGNGRMGRFLMNLMAAAAGFPWIIIPVEKRKLYLSSLEEASTRQNIVPFSKFLSDLM